MKGDLNERSSQPMVLLMEDRFISNQPDRPFVSRAGSGLELQFCFPAAISRLRQSNRSLNLPSSCFVRSPVTQPEFCTGGALDLP